MIWRLVLFLSPVPIVIPQSVDVSGLLSTGLAVVSIATLAGLGLLRGTVTNLREQLKDARDEIRSLKESRSEMLTENATLTADLSALKRVVTGEVHWVTLEGKLDEHHDEAEGHWTRTEAFLEEIRDRLPRDHQEPS